MVWDAAKHRPAFREDSLNWVVDLLFNAPQRGRYRWKFRHNPAPGPEYEPLPDGRGRRYWLRTYAGQRLMTLCACYRGEEVGRVGWRCPPVPDETKAGVLENLASMRTYESLP